MSIMTCDSLTCLYYAFLTFLAVIAGTIALDILAYAVWAYYVGQTYSRDLISTRDKELKLLA